MSGGHFNYGYARILELAESIEYYIEENDVYSFSAETIEVLKDCQGKIKKAGRLARSVEWLYSGDTGEDSFAEDVKSIS